MKSSKPQKSRVYLSIELLKKFSKKELESLGYFAENKYFNTDKDLAQLLKQLIKEALKKDKFTAEIQLKVYQAVFGKLASSQKELNKKQKDYLTNKLNALLRLAEQFLMVDAMQGKEQYKFELLYPKLIDKKQTLLFNRHLNRDTKKLDAEKKQGIEYYDKKYKCEKAKHDYFFREGLITKEDNYNELQYYLDVSFLLDKLQYHLAQVTLKNNFVNKQFDLVTFELIQPLLSQPEYANISLVCLYLLNIELVIKKDDITFHKLLQTTIDESDEIPKNILKIFYSNLSNYCVLQIGYGKLDFHQYLWNVYKQMHEQDLLQKDGFIDLRLIKNVITSSCSVKEIDWALQIIEYYKPLIHPSIQESVYHYNLGIIAFNQNLFELAHDYFIKVDKIDDAHEVNVRILLLKCIYEKEQDYSDATLQSFLSAKIFFKRNTSFTESNKKAFTNFVTILIELYKYKLNESNKNILFVKNKLQTIRYINNKAWLLNKLSELENM